jgi:hypothetical protein
MDLKLTDEQSAALVRELDQIIDGDRYFLSPRIKTLREIRAMIKPYPQRPPPSPAMQHFEPPSKGRTGDAARR